MDSKSSDQLFSGVRDLQHIKYTCENNRRRKWKSGYLNPTQRALSMLLDLQQILIYLGRLI